MVFEKRFHFSSGESYEWENVTLPPPATRTLGLDFRRHRHHKQAHTFLHIVIIIYNKLLERGLYKTLNLITPTQYRIEKVTYDDKRQLGVLKSALKQILIFDVL